ncbi:hypothetical protein BDV32DRAFT_161282 [Aspergillus pseudonomiae]|uniref:Uncharacterized protein n=1 Tax=Aspergillus pseudonomiae TaxID=1506151 RepID=A0A5N7D3S4_9EURO|nr:uncharacterized protein BDV37DRAFT_296636 [Aspergillus pseudonomiae]KAB8256183.1 hypothetical protein BDV32DRAFT_161282 [Aspergillus pseudonomiae]KAE8400767.1 hypothetical protein BDV37DRAFT_296636 [Aspergillus pseudonomiae]
MRVDRSVYRMMHLCIIGLALFAFTLALPSPTEIQDPSTSIDGVPRLEARDAKPFALRIMPLGASITTGLKSSDKNGYRIWIREQLRHAGWEVNMVGSLKSGTMRDNDNEGWSGWVIDQVAQEAEKTIPKAPNLILINAGTNDAVKDLDVDRAGERMNVLLTRLYEGIPGTTIILSTLLSNGDPKAQANVVKINEQYRNIAAARRKNGDKIVLAEMSDFIKVSELVDGTHPNDFGYKKMASVWWAAIQEAESAKFLSKPKDIGESDWAYTTCEKKFGSGNDGGKIQTQRGSGWDDGDYKHNAQSMGRIKQIGITGSKGDTHPGINYAQLVNQGGAHREGALDELVWTRDGKGTWMYPNNNNGKFGEPVKIDVKDNCLARGVHWGDLNNDGLDDFICISREGAMYASMNQGGSPPQFKYIGLVREAPGGDLAQANVRLGDIDGDGRLDYCLVKGNGDIQCWRNGGQKDAPTPEFNGYWQDLGTVFTGKGMGDIAGVRLVDINGDFRADWLWLDEEGKVTTYINQRGTGKGSLAPDWRRIGVTHAGMGVKGARDRIKFGQVYAKGGADYVWIESLQNADTYNHYTTVWKNIGSGGTTLKGDGDYYCDWRGTGADDYIWISPTGRALLYGNVHKPPTWVPEGPQIFDLGRDRKGIHLADFNGDGKCDVWAVNRETGAAEVWINHWNEDTTSGFLDYRGVVTGNVKCTEGWGVGYRDIGVRMADLDGDGRADYLCMEPNGRTVGWLNKGENKFEAKGQVKRTHGYDRANHVWADVDGDGLVDFLWVDKFNGNTKVWINKGPIPTAGSSWKWELLDGPRYQGSDRGAYTWFNTCPGSDSTAADDVDPSVDPDLPAYTPPNQPTPTGTPPVSPTATGIPIGEAPDGYYEHWPLNDRDRMESVCNHLDELDKDLWNKNDMGNWLTTTAGWYQKLSLNPDLNLDPDHPFKWPGGLADALAKYNGSRIEVPPPYSWECANVRGSCTVNHLKDVDPCKEGRMYRVQALTAVHNLAEFLRVMYSMTEEIWTNAGFKNAGLVLRYSHKGDENTEFGEDAGMTIGAGFASIMGAFFLTPMAGVAAGAMTIGAGAVAALGGLAPADLKFNTYAQLGDKSADMHNAMTQGLDVFYNSLFFKKPPTDPSWVTSPTALPRILNTGNFASHKSVVAPTDEETSKYSMVPEKAGLVKYVVAPLINMLWQKDLYYIVRIDNKSIRNSNGETYHPCDKNGDMFENTDTTNMKWCNPDDTAFFFYHQGDNDHIPKGMDKLPDDYGFNGYDVARSSYLVQRTTNEWQSKVNIDSYFSWVPQTSGSDIPAWQMMRWNLPVCDLAEYGVEEECGSGLLWDVCMYSIIKEVCGRRDGWPKDYDFISGLTGRPLPHKEEGTPYSKPLSPAEAVQLLMG